MRRSLPPGSDLQAAINAAKPGDVLVLDAATIYTGPLTLPAKTDWVTITSSAVLPHRRITPADAHLLPTIRSGSADAAITGYGAKHWRIDGVRFEPTTNGHETLIVLQDADAITLDRILFTSPEDVGQKRGVLGNGTRITLTRSHLAGIWAEGADSQAFCAWDGAGPYTITDNYLEAASENVMFGGADSQSEDRIPSDIRIERNHLAKPLAWQGQWRVVKNLIELKCARRVTVRANLLERCWVDAQEGYAIVITVRNQDGRAPWSRVEDVLIEHNVIRDTWRGLNFSGIDDEKPSGQGARLTVRNNLFLVADWFLVAGNEWHDAIIEANTLFYNGAAQVLSAGWVRTPDLPDGRPALFAIRNHTFRNNLAYMNEYGFFGDGGIPWESYIDGALDFTNNALADRQSGQVMPGANAYPSDADHCAQFGPQFRVRPDSPYQTGATDGGCLGVRLDDVPEPPEDTVAPDVRIVQIRREPETTHYVIRVQTRAPDVARVEYLVDGELLNSETQWPYDGHVDIADAGAHVIVARALDGAGNAGYAARTLVLTLLLLLLLVATGRAQAPSIGVAWEQPGAPPAVAQTYVYRAYLDGQPPVILQGVVCKLVNVTTECSAPLPTPSNGDHTLFLTAQNATAEGERSGTVSFTYPPPSAPPPPTVGAPIAPQNLWIIRGSGS